METPFPCVLQVVNNAPVPPVYRHSPHCSFSNSHSNVAQTQQIPMPREATPPKTPPPQPPLYSLQEIHAFVEELVEEEVAELRRPVVEMALAEV